MSETIEKDTLLKVKDLKKYYPIKKGVFRTTAGYVRAVESVSFDLNKGKTLGLVGESGCGKTTLGRCLLRLIEPTEGKIYFKCKDKDMANISKFNGKELRSYREEAQIVFQNPYGSLNPNQTIFDTLNEPLKVMGLRNKFDREERIVELLNSVNLSPHYMFRYPHQFSGGQRQRIVLARSLSVNPKLLVCDEPVSALDVSVQTQVLNLLKGLQEKLELTFIFIAHDLSVVEYMSDEIAVMYLGRIIEKLPAEKLEKAQHPYTKALISSIPRCDPLLRNEQKIILEGEVGDPSNPPSGCAFHPRCPYKKELCKQEIPLLKLVANEKSHEVACHYFKEIMK